MSTITREFTKEQLIEHIKGRKEFADECAADSTLHPERREYYELTAEALRIALASLEAEAVAWRCGSTVTVNKPVADDWKRRGFAFHPLYAAPPAPVVPEEMPKGLAGQIISLLAHNIGDKFLAQKIWNACRTAMLQGADGSSPVVPDGWALVPVELTPDMRSAWDSAPHTDDDDHDMQVAYRTMIAASPQQEVK